MTNLFNSIIGVHTYNIKGNQDEPQNPKTRSREKTLKPNQLELLLIWLNRFNPNSPLRAPWDNACYFTKHALNQAWCCVIVFGHKVLNLMYTIWLFIVIQHILFEF